MVWFGHKERGFAVVVFIVIAGTRLWTSVGTAVAFIIEDRRASREMRRAAEKEAEQAPAVSPVAAIELVVERKDETITEGSPYYRAMQRRAELAIKIAGYGGLCFVLYVISLISLINLT